MKKHIEDLRNALYKHDLTVAAEEDTPAFPSVWTLAHPYFTLPLTIAFHNAHDTGLVPLYASFGCYLMEKPEISLYFTKTNRHSWQRDLAAFMMSSSAESSSTAPWMFSTRMRVFPPPRPRRGSTGARTQAITAHKRRSPVC